MSTSLFDVKVTAKLDKIGKKLIFEIQVKDEEGTDLTSLFRFFTRLEESDIDNKDLIDVTVIKAPE
jgi:hypothetical protein